MTLFRCERDETETTSDLTDLKVLVWLPFWIVWVERGLLDERTLLLDHQ